MVQCAVTAGIHQHYATGAGMPTGKRDQGWDDTDKRDAHNSFGIHQ